jgi:hypothetical protein
VADSNVGSIQEGTPEFARQEWAKSLEGLNGEYGAACKGEDAAGSEYSGKVEEPEKGTDAADHRMSPILREVIVHRLNIAV